MPTYSNSMPHTSPTYSNKKHVSGSAVRVHPWEKAGFAQAGDPLASVPVYYSWMGSMAEQPPGVEVVHSQSMKRVRPYSASTSNCWQSLTPARSYGGTVGLPHTTSARTISHTFLNPSSSCVRGPRTNSWPNRSCRDIETSYERQFRLFNTKSQEREAQIRRNGKPLKWSPDELQLQIQDKIRQHTSGKLGISLEAFRLFCNDPEADAGNINFDQFHTTLNNMLNTKVSKEDAQGLFDRYDLDGGGSISLAELVAGFDADVAINYVDTSNLPDSDPVTYLEEGPKFRRVETIPNWKPPIWCTPTKCNKKHSKARFEGTPPENSEEGQLQGLIEQDIQQYTAKRNDVEACKPKARPKSASVCRQMERMNPSRTLTFKEKERARRVIPMAPTSFSRY